MELPVRGGRPDTKLQSRYSAVCHVVVSTITLVRLLLSQEWFRCRGCDVGCVCSKRQVGWRGPARQRDGLTSACWFGLCLGDGQQRARAFSMDVVQQWICNAMDQVECRQADARASCTGLSVPFHTSAGRCCGNKVVTRRD